jgi:uncharacterized membrane protein YhaH (DUF805 family)
VTIVLAVIAAAWKAAQWPILIYYLAALLPSLAVLVRRLHDTGRSGWWVFGSIAAGALMAFANVVPKYALVFAVPAFLLALIILAFTIQGGQHGINRYGPNSKAVQ